jgi:flagellin
MADVVLTAAMQANLLSLQNTQQLLDNTQLQLATGLKVNSALDNPVEYFAAQGLNNRASDLSNLLDSMGQAIQTVQAANNGITGITSFLQQALALARGALANAQAHNGTNTNASADSTTFSGLTQQISHMAADSNYQGVALLNGTSNKLKVVFSEANTTSALTLSGVDLTPSGLNVTGANNGGSLKLDNTTDINTTIAALDTAITQVRNDATSFSNSLSIIQTRQSFTSSLINTLTTGANDLTVADKNAEGAKLLALQTTQQLGITSLSLASQANQSILKLFP